MREGRERIRLFLGVEISTASVDALAETARALRTSVEAAGGRVRWVAPSRYHITLKFLGWCMPEIVTALRDRLTAPVAELPRFEFAVRGLGAFPDPGRARVLWAGVEDPDGGLDRLVTLIEDESDRLGFARERRSFHPHVTLGRIDPPADVDEVLTDASERVFGNDRVRAVTLFESTMNSVGSRYEQRARFALARASRERKRQTEGLQRPASDGPAAAVDARGSVEPRSDTQPSSLGPDQPHPEPGEHPSDRGDDA
ncbi:RNA 2',3'-cyclic phosphodiesterase [Haliangium sp.]|uniref:RNA 2',3'-cyclic phosphodiesterase n=1 Tax=Haliangium sp. TaxID=2663208 RepID=UPI003D0F77CC